MNAVTEESIKTSGASEGRSDFHLRGDINVHVQKRYFAMQLREEWKQNKTFIIMSLVHCGRR